MTGHGFRAVASSRGFGPWAVATVGARLPIAMAPLALVLAAEAATGSYGFGGILVAAHTVGEIIGSPIMGRLADRRPSRLLLTAVLLAQGVGFGVLAWALTGAFPQWCAVLLVAVVGVVAAGVPGALRSRLTRMVPERSTQPALSIDSAINQVCWGAAPVIVTAVAASAPTQVLVVVAAPAVASCLACLIIPSRPAEPRSPSSGPTITDTVRTLSDVLVGTILMRVALGVMAVAAVPAFTALNHPTVAGLALGAYAVATGIGALALGSTRHPCVDPARRAHRTLVLLALALTPAVLFAHNVVGLVAVFVFVGLIEGPTVVALSVAVQQRTPPEVRATAFSVQYAALGVGFALGSISLGPLLTVMSPAAAMTCIGFVILVGALILSRWKYRSPHVSRRQEQ